MMKFTAQSKTEQGKTYQLFLKERGWHCSCPQFLFREKQIKHCKHITEKQRQLEDLLVKYVPEQELKALGIEIYQPVL